MRLLPVISLMMNSYESSLAIHPKNGLWDELRKFYSVFSTVFLMYFSCCLLLVMGSCYLCLILKMFW